MPISPAYAQASETFGGLDAFSLLPLVLIFVVFYFLLIRPQQKRVKQHKEMITSLRRGDRVVTGGGIVGRITRVEGDNELIVEIAPEVRVRLKQATVAELLSRGAPAEKSAPSEAATKGADAEVAKSSSAKRRGGRKTAVRKRAG